MQTEHHSAPPDPPLEPVTRVGQAGTFVNTLSKTKLPPITKVGGGFAGAGSGVEKQPSVIGQQPTTLVERDLAEAIRQEEVRLKNYQNLAQESAARLLALKTKQISSLQEKKISAAIASDPGFGGAATMREPAPNAESVSSYELKDIADERASLFLASLLEKENAEKTCQENEDAALALQFQLEEKEAEERARQENKDIEMAQALMRMYSEEDRQRLLDEEAELERLRIADRAEREANTETRVYECRICLDPELPIDDLYIIDGCSHKYCSTCLTNHCTSTIESGTPDVECPCEGCKELIETLQIKQLLSLSKSENSAAVLDRLENMFQDRFMESDPLYVRCPRILEGAGGIKTPCNMWGMRDEIGSKNAKCQSDTCNYQFCAECGYRKHDESCEDFAIIGRAERGDSGAADELMRQWRANSHSKPVSTPHPPL